MKWPIQGSLGMKNVYVSRLFDSAAVRWRNPPIGPKDRSNWKLKQHFKSNSKHEISDETDYYQFTKQWHKENVADLCTKNEAEMKSTVNSIFGLQVWFRQTTFVIEIPDSFTILPCIYVSKPFKSPPWISWYLLRFKLCLEWGYLSGLRDQMYVFMLLQVGAKTAFVN